MNATWVLNTSPQRADSPLYSLTSAKILGHSNIAPSAIHLTIKQRASMGAPGVVNFDLSLFKKFALDEERALEFRAEFFNAFNNPHFANPNTSQGASNFGRISGTVLTPREIQFGLKLSF